MSVEISVVLLASLVVMLLSFIVTTILHKKCGVLLEYHQLSITILLGAATGLAFQVTAFLVYLNSFVDMARQHLVQKDSST